MTSLAIVLGCLLIAGVSGFSVRGFKGRPQEYDKRDPAALLLERGIIPEYDVDPEVCRDTAWFLDRIILNDAQIMPGPVPPEVKYRFPSGNKQECIDGKKTIPPQCQWSGLVVMEKMKPPQLLKLTVAKKYCTAVGLDMPDDKVIDCEE